MKAWMIVNPRAGTAETEPVAGLLRRLTDRPGVTVRRSGGMGEARELATQAIEAGAEMVIAAGGDGTVSEVVNGMSGGLDRTRLAVIPAGTANDFATTLGIADADAAEAMLGAGAERRVDLIRCEHAGGVGPPGARLIINACTGGFSEVVHDKLTPEVKQGWGPLAYLRAAIDAMPEICFHDATMTIDGEPLQIETCSVVIANGRSAGGMELDPQAKVDDGWIDVLLITARTFLEEMRLATRFLAGTHLKSDDVVFRRGRDVRIKTEPPMHFSSDGELIGRTPIRFTILPQALRVVVPRT